MGPLLQPLRHVSLALLIVAVLAPPAAPRPAHESVDIVGFSDAASAVVERAVGRFREAGLELPALSVHRSHNAGVCRGRIAYHRGEPSGSKIVLCYPLVDGREWRILLHELTHAWASVGLTEERQAEFREVRGYEHWRDYQHAAWHENGTEQAAEIVKWGLSDVPVPMYILDASCEQLHDGYVALIGAEPLHGLKTLCD